MFTADEIKTRVKQSPFIPFRLVTSSGESYDVYHPDLILVGRRDLTVGIGSSDQPTVYEQVSRVALMHITALEDLPVPAPPPTGNGQK